MFASPAVQQPGTNPNAPLSNGQQPYTGNYTTNPYMQQQAQLFNSGQQQQQPYNVNNNPYGQQIQQAFGPQQQANTGPMQQQQQGAPGYPQGQYGMQPQAPNLYTGQQIMSGGAPNGQMIQANQQMANQYTLQQQQANPALLQAITPNNGWGNSQPSAADGMYASTTPGSSVYASPAYQASNAQTGGWQPTPGVNYGTAGVNPNYNGGVQGNQGAASGNQGAGATGNPGGIGNIFGGPAGGNGATGNGQLFPGGQPAPANANFQNQMFPTGGFQGQTGNYSPVAVPPNYSPSSIGVQGLQAPSPYQVGQLQAPGAYQVGQLQAPGAYQVGQLGQVGQAQTPQFQQQNIDPIDQTSAWQAMVGAENRNVQEQAANLGAQLDTSGNRFSSAFGTSMSDYYSQTAATQNAALTQAQTQAMEQAQQLGVQAGEQTQSLGASAAQQQMSLQQQQALQGQSLQTQAGLAAQGYGVQEAMQGQQLGTQAGLQAQQIGAQYGLQGQQLQQQSGIAAQALGAQEGMQTQSLGTQAGLAAQQQGTQEALQGQQLATQSGEQAQQLSEQYGMGQLQMGGQEGIAQMQTTAQEQEQLSSQAFQGQLAQYQGGLTAAGQAAGMESGAAQQLLQNAMTGGLTQENASNTAANQLLGNQTNYAENYGNYLNTATGLQEQNTQLGAGLGQQQYNNQQSAINNSYQQWLYQQPQNNPLLSLLNGQSTAYPPVTYPGYTPNQLGGLMSGLGSLLGLIPGLSDARLKEDIQHIPHTDIERFTRLRPATWKWRGTNIQDSGFIAQEVEEVAPDLVVTYPFGIKALNYRGIMSHMLEKFAARAKEN